MFTTKTEIPSRTELACVHCGGPIRYRPTMIGYRMMDRGIETTGIFCSWSCARTYATANCQSDQMEELTTRIMQEYREELSEGDDPDGHNFLQNYLRFSCIPHAPPRHAFTPFGPLSYDEYRRQWSNEGSSFRSSALQSPSSDAVCFETDTEIPMVFRRTTTYSSRQMFRKTAWPCMWNH